MNNIAKRYAEITITMSCDASDVAGSLARIGIIGIEPDDRKYLESMAGRALSREELDAISVAYAEEIARIAAQHGLRSHVVNNVHGIYCRVQSRRFYVNEYRQTKQ